MIKLYSSNIDTIQKVFLDFLSSFRKRKEKQHKITYIYYKYEEK